MDGFKRKIDFIQSKAIQLSKIMDEKKVRKKDAIMREIVYGLVKGLCELENLYEKEIKNLKKKKA